MLIRSQNKEVLVAFENLLNIEVSGGVISTRVDNGWSCLLGEYSAKAKALKVLDMIQETYADAKLNEILLPDVCKSASESQRGKDNTLIAKTIRKDFMKKMIFQMPADSEVEA
jgi:hypothetical protein